MTEYKQRLKDKQNEMFKQRMNAKNKKDDNYMSKVIAKVTFVLFF